MTFGRVFFVIFMSIQFVYFFFSWAGGALKVPGWAGMGGVGFLSTA